MKTKSDIQTDDDVKKLVHTFYAKVRADELLSPVFNEIIKDDWTEHLETMCKFWSTMLRYTGTYRSEPMSKHLPLRLSNEHFLRWIFLFRETIDELFEGKVASDAKYTADNIGRVMRNVKKIPF